MSGEKERGREGGKERRTAQGGIGARDDRDGVCGPTQALVEEGRWRRREEERRVE